MKSAGRGVRGFGPFVVGVLELVALVMVSGWIGFGWALLLLFSTSILGLALLRFEGFRAWSSLRQAVAEGKLDGDPDEATAKMADTGVRMLAGAVLTLPGFVTDAFALVLLVPPIRKSMGRRLSAAALRTFPGSAMPPNGRKPAAPDEPVVIEGEVVGSDGVDER